MANLEKLQLEKRVFLAACVCIDACKRLKRTKRLAIDTITDTGLQNIIFVFILKLTCFGLHNHI